MTAGKIAAVVVMVIALFAMMVGSGFVGFFNTSTRLTASYEAKVDANKADFDNMWKTLKQVASVPDQHRKGFESVMTKYAEARTGGGEGSGDTFLSIMNEAVPDFTGSADLFAKIQTVVEAKREGWTMRQKELRDLKREHDTLLRTFPGAFYNGFIGHEELVAVVITSGKTKETFASGEENDVNLF